MEIHNPANQDLKCPTCQQSFATIEKHKQHYKSDYHRYNLKRKMVKLSPVTLQQFQAKKVQIKKLQVLQLKCYECGKKFNSMQTMGQHARSKGHQISKPEQQQGEITDQIQVHEKKIPEIYMPNTHVCIFCHNKSQSLDNNLTHMLKAHSFFIPQPQFCTDLQGLIKHLQQKIQVGFMCICCENKKAKDFNSGLAVRKHMTDKGHNFMKVQNGYEQYEKFYDFSSLFTEMVQQQKGRSVPGIQYTEVRVYDNKKLPQANKQRDNGNGNDDQQWEDEEQSQNASQNDEWQSASEEENSQEQQIRQKKPENRIKTYYLMKPTITGNQQLLLPNGKTLGHRKYRHIYRQNYQSPLVAHKLKMLGYESGSSAAMSINNILATRQNIMREIKNDIVTQKTYKRAGRQHVGLGMQTNILIRKYFRCQNSL